LTEIILGAKFNLELGMRNGVGLVGVDGATVICSQNYKTFLFVIKGQAKLARVFDHDENLKSCLHFAINKGINTIALILQIHLVY